MHNNILVKKRMCVDGITPGSILRQGMRNLRKEFNSIRFNLKLIKWLNAIKILKNWSNMQRERNECSYLFNYCFESYRPIKTLNQNFFRSIYTKKFRNMFVIEIKLSLSDRRGKSMHYPESPKVRAWR